jgi:type I restriction enzyme S subunit
VLRRLSESRNATQPNLNGEIVKSLKVVLPPIAEQEKIVSAVGIETKMVVSAAEHARREIGLLGEYRTRLIADVVTGKLDVREAAALLADETKESEAFDEAEAESEVERAADDGEELSEEAEA